MFRNRLFLGAAAAAVVLFVAGSAFSADTIVLRRTCKAGDKYVAEVLSNQKMKRSNGEATAEMKQTLSMTVGMEVVSVAADGIEEIKVTYRRIALKLEAPGASIDYDSADPVKKDVAHQALADVKARLGRSLTLMVTDRGVVKEVRGVGDIQAAILAQVPEANREQARQQLAQSMSPEMVAEQMSVFALRLPEEAKAAGESWSYEVTTNPGFATLNVKTSYKVEKINADTVELTGTAAAQVGKAAEGFTVVMDPASNAVGKTALNRANAALFASDLKQLMKMSIAYQGRTLVSEMESTSSIAVKPQ